MIKKNKDILKVSKRLMGLFPSLIAALIGGLVYYKNSSLIDESLIAALMVFCTTAYGFTINNIIDRFKDKNAPKTRNKIDLVNNLDYLRLAKINTALFLTLSIVTSINLNIQAIVINFTVLIVLTVYSFINNNYGILANILTSLCPALLIWIYPVNNQLFGPSVILFAFVFIFVLSREIVMDVNDKDADEKIGKSSFPIIFGEKLSKLFAISFLLVSSIILILLVFINSYDITLLFPLIGSTLVASIGYMAYIRNHNDRGFINFFNITSASYLLIFLYLI